MSLLGEEALKQVWGLVKERIAEEKQKYKWKFENENCTVTIFRQNNICILHITVVSEVSDMALEIPTGFRSEESINNEELAMLSEMMTIKKLNAEQTYSLTYYTSNLVPDEKYKM